MYLTRYVFQTYMNPNMDMVFKKLENDDVKLENYVRLGNDYENLKII